MTDLLLKDAPDPEAFGKIRSIVKSAHKWGGDGAVPKFRKIRRVLTSKHPEVIAKAFGGNPDVAAAWIKDNWYAVHGRVVTGKTGVGPTYWRGKGKVNVSLYSSWFEPVPVDFACAEDDNVIDLFCASSKGAEEKDGYVWKQVLREGSWQRNPIPGTKGPLVIDKAFMEELVASFQDGAWEFVTVPLSHADLVDQNTGYVRALELRKDPKKKGKYILMAGLEFTEPEIAAKVKRGTIANVSVGVGFNVARTEDGKKFGKVLKHIALTNMPWINGLQPFGKQMAASQAVLLPSYEEDGEVDLEALDLSVLERVLDLARPANPKFDESQSFDAIRCLVQESLRNFYVDADGDAVVAPDGSRSEEYDAEDAAAEDGMVNTGNYGTRLYVQGLTTDTALAMQDANYGDPVPKGWMFGYHIEDGRAVIDPVDEWMPVQKTWIRLSQEFQLAIESVWEEGVEEVTVPRNQEQEAQAVAGEGIVGGDPPKTEDDPPGTLSIGVETTTEPGSLSQVVTTDSANPPAVIPPHTSGRTRDDVKRTSTKRTIRIVESKRGGENMPEENNEETKETEVTLSREDLDKIINERVEAGLSAARDAAKAEAVAERQSLEMELSKNRKAVHVMRVKEQIAELNAAGHAPTLVTKAQEILLADEKGEVALNLSREGAEVTLSATEIVLELLAAIPATALTEGQPAVKLSQTKPDEGAGQDADKLYEELFGKNAKPAVTI